MKLYTKRNEVRKERRSWEKKEKQNTELTTSVENYIEQEKAKENEEKRKKKKRTYNSNEQRLVRKDVYLFI